MPSPKPKTEQTRKYALDRRTTRALNPSIRKHHIEDHTNQVAGQIFFLKSYCLL
jgi:hypothetical protein